jgi:hypothetical protein
MTAQGPEQRGRLRAQGKIDLVAITMAGCGVSGSRMASKMRKLTYRILLQPCGHEQTIYLKLNNFMQIQHDRKSEGPPLRTIVRQKERFALLASPQGVAATGTNFQIEPAVREAIPRFADLRCHVGKYNCIVGKIFCQAVKMPCRIGNAHCVSGK